MRKLTDEYGNVYNVDPSILSTPTDGGPEKLLFDQRTGETFSLPASLFDDDPGAAADPGPGLPEPTPGYQEKLIEILLEKCTLTAPGARERVELLIGPILAIGKITSREEFSIVQMEIENLIRALYISNAITDADAAYLMDQIEFFARWQARRSITFDGKPNEREWLTVQSIHKKTEVTGEQPGAGILASIGRAFGKGRY